jgi:iron complex transport system ATP-binding protein
MDLTLHNATISGRIADVTATFAPGTITAICGPNGAGKSTLLAALAGLLPLDSGTASAAALPVRERARRIGFLPQSGEAAWNLSVQALAALGRLPHGDDAAEPVERALEAVGLAHMAQRPIATLSGGERARALLARVLAGQPLWILADEPLAALDLAHQRALLHHLRGAADQGAGVVLVLHDLPLAMNYADQVIVLHNKKIAANGPPEQALHETVIAQVWQVQARWLGDPGARALSVG